MSKRPSLVFVSPRFLFPTDEGGKIRTTQILRGMKGGRFHITLMSPATPEQTARHREEIEAVCDRFIAWPARTGGPLHKITRLRHLLSFKPFSVAAGVNPVARRRVREQLQQGAQIAVFDFIHAATLAPIHSLCPTVMFTHNVEAEIFRRHAEVAGHPLKRYVWRGQHRKMARFEARELPRFDTVVAVSERDAEAFRAMPRNRRVAAIPTGVDLDFFAYLPPGDGDHLIFTGAMDWQANIDGIRFFMDEVWPLLVQRRPGVRMTVVGRRPHPELVEQAARRNLPWTFTGFVDDIRPHVYGGAAYVIPLRVGGGTRIKAYEAMAMGLPVVSTGLGVEGLPLTDGEQFLQADTPEAMAQALDRLLSDSALRLRLSQAARRHVEDHCSSLAVARCFEDICLRTMNGQG
ncbi:glycosyltransferase [Ectothiorhodospira lacustris]|uniref:glycosyltransferase n=1 Tax=Ectothiorhodospira lacustris TaxID=2899127 RepID=UPI001EE8EC89|nr:glycosyltransferase family 4 protein [Ectothiorhodospira lacustris]MCG5522080.1 glycosyltransferase family 4 protein [Ectothiorhodospira lacustris]